MERHVNFVLIGSLFFFITLMLVAFLLWFGRINIGDDKTRKYYIYTEYDISGIALRTPVKYKGIIVGNVSRIAFDREHIGLVKITLAINKEIPVAEGSSLVIDSQGLAGLNYLSLRQNPNGKIIGDSGDARLTLEKNFMGKMADNADQIATGLIEVLNNSHALMSENNIKNIASTIESLSAFASRLNSLSSSLDVMMKSTASIAKNLDKKLQDGQYDLAPTLIQAQRSLQNLDAFLQKGSNILDKFNDNPYTTLFGEHK